MALHQQVYRRIRLADPILRRPRVLPVLLALALFATLVMDVGPASAQIVEGYVTDHLDGRWPD